MVIKDLEEGSHNLLDGTNYRATLCNPWQEYI